MVSKLRLAGIFGKGIWGLVKLGLLFFFILYVLTNIIIVSIDKQDPSLAIKEIGEEIINPLQSAQKISLQIVSGESGIMDYWKLLFNIYILWLWFKAIMLLVDFFLNLKNTNSYFSLYLLTFGLFYGTLVVYSVVFLSESPNYPLNVFKDVFAGVKHVFLNINLSEGKEKIIESTNDCVEGVCSY